MSIKRTVRSARDLDKVTVRQWLDGLGQVASDPTAAVRPHRPCGAQRTIPRCLATGFAQVLRKIFYRDVESTRWCGFVGLSELYTGAARAFIEKRGGRVLESKKTASFYRGRGRVKGIVTDSGDASRRNATISTLAPGNLKKLPLQPLCARPWETLTAAPIVRLTLWLDRPLLTRTSRCMLGTEIQWADSKQERGGPCCWQRLLTIPAEGNCLRLLKFRAGRFIWLKRRPLA